MCDVSHYYIAVMATDDEATLLFTAHVSEWAELEVGSELPLAHLPAWAGFPASYLGMNVTVDVKLGTEADSDREIRSGGAINSRSAGKMRNSETC